MLCWALGKQCQDPHKGKIHTWPTILGLTGQGRNKGNPLKCGESIRCSGCPGTVRAKNEKDSVKQSAKMAPDNWNSVCKGPKGSRLLCLQDFVGVSIRDAEEQAEGGQTWAAAGSRAGLQSKQVKP